MGRRRALHVPMWIPTSTTDQPLRGGKSGRIRGEADEDYRHEEEHEGFELL